MLRRLRPRRLLPQRPLLLKRLRLSKSKLLIDIREEDVTCHILFSCCLLSPLLAEPLLLYVGFLLVLRNLQFQVRTVGIDVWRHNLNAIAVEGVEDVVMQL